MTANRRQRVCTYILSNILVGDIIIHSSRLHLGVSLGGINWCIVITHFEKFAWTLQESVHTACIRC